MPNNWIDRVALEAATAIANTPQDKVTDTQLDHLIRTWMLAGKATSPGR